MAKQQGEYLAKLLTSGKAVPKQPLKDVRPFRYTHRGSLAYVGRDKAVMDVPNVGPLFGWQAGIMSTFCPEWWWVLGVCPVLVQSMGGPVQVWRGRDSRLTASSARGT